MRKPKIKRGCYIKPNTRKKVGVIMKKKWKDDSEYRNKMLRILRKENENPNLRKKSSMRLNTLWGSLKFRHKMKQANNKRWKDPIYRIKMQSCLLKIKSKKGPNKFEKCVFLFLNSSSRIKFKFVGAGPEAILVNGYSPDFINKREKIIILANGVYWHLGKYGIDVNEKNKRTAEKIKAAPFKKAGYRVIQIWEDEFNRGELKWKNLKLKKIGK